MGNGEFRSCPNLPASMMRQHILPRHPSVSSNVENLLFARQSENLPSVEALPILSGYPLTTFFNVTQMSSNEYQHLNELSKIKYLVIDEADRMIQMGSFPQLSNILDAVQMANPMDDEEEEEGDFADLGDDPDSMDRLLGLPGIRGEARVTMLTDDILKKVNALREEDKPKIDDETVESDDESVADASANEDAELAGMNDEEEIPLPAEPPVDRQTFVFSATLTLPATNTAKPTKKRRHSTTVGGAIAEILDRAHAKGKTKVVDLATNTKGNEIIDKNDKPGKKEKPKEKSGVKKSKFQLPPGLQLHQVKCTQKHKDSHLYAYLMTTTEGSSGPCLVFCNSIACVRRVGKMLQTLGLDVRILHAQMQQVSFWWGPSEILRNSRFAMRITIFSRPDPSKRSGSNNGGFVNNL